MLEYSCTFRCYSRVATTRLPLALACAPDHTYSSICGAISGQGLLPHRPSPPPLDASHLPVCVAVAAAAVEFLEVRGRIQRESETSMAVRKQLRTRRTAEAEKPLCVTPYPFCPPSRCLPLHQPARVWLGISIGASSPPIDRASHTVSLSRRTHFQPTSTPPPTDFHPSPPLFLSACHLAYLPACLPCPPSVRSRT